MLTGNRIIDCVQLGHIVIDPFRREHVNPNSVDLTLAEILREVTGREVEDPDHPSHTIQHLIPPEGFILLPGRLYLASTVERTSCTDYVPCLHGKSSLARRGLVVHLTAGFGDHGYSGTWTLEMTVVVPLKVRAGMRICQVSFTPIIGQPMPYRGRYQGQEGPTPSRSHYREE